MTTTQHDTTAYAPTAGRYAIDPSHSSVSFTARHLMVTKVRGRLAVTGGEIVVADEPGRSSVKATIDAASITSGDPKRDEHLRSADFFDVERFPTISFESTTVEDHGDGTFTLHGNLAVRDVRQPISLRGEYLGTEQSPWGDTRIGFSAETDVNRKEWGLEWNVALETGGLLVGDKIKLEIDVEAVKQ